MNTVIKTCFVTSLMYAGLFTINEIAYASAEAKCKACHDFGTQHKVGPALAGIVGKKAGSSDFKRYSVNLKNGNWTWNEANLRIWLVDSTTAIKEFTGNPEAKTTMPPQRLSDAELDQVIDYLISLNLDSAVDRAVFGPTP